MAERYRKRAKINICRAPAHVNYCAQWRGYPQCAFGLQNLLSNFLLFVCSLSLCFSLYCRAIYTYCIVSRGHIIFILSWSARGALTYAVCVGATAASRAWNVWCSWRIFGSEGIFPFAVFGALHGVIFLKCVFFLCCCGLTQKRCLKVYAVRRRCGRAWEVLCSWRCIFECEGIFRPHFLVWALYNLFLFIPLSEKVVVDMCDSCTVELPARTISPPFVLRRPRGYWSFSA